MVGGETRHQHQPSTMHLRFLDPPDSAGRDWAYGHVSCRALDPPVGGTFLLEISVMPLSQKSAQKRFLPPKGGSLSDRNRFWKKNFQGRERILLSALAPARRAAAASEPKAPPSLLAVRAHHGARPCWRKSTCWSLRRRCERRRKRRPRLRPRGLCRSPYRLARRPNPAFHRGLAICRLQPRRARCALGNFPHCLTARSALAT